MAKGEIGMQIPQQAIDSPEKSVIRTHPQLGVGSDYMDLVRRMRFERTTLRVGGLWHKLITPVFKRFSVGVAQIRKRYTIVLKALCSKELRAVFKF